MWDDHKNLKNNFGKELQNIIIHQLWLEEDV